MSINQIYLDYNASTPLDPQVLEVIAKELQEELGNPSSSHSFGQKSRRKLDQSRQLIANFFKVKSQEIIFTSCGTEGAALLLQGIIFQEPKLHIISSKTEHPCVYQTLLAAGKKGAEVTFLPSNLQGSVLAEDVERAIRPHTRLITLMAVNNETGAMTDLEGIASIAQKADIPLIVDGVAWLGKELISIPSGISGLFFSGHKIHAPKGIGFCICRQKMKLIPLFFGGDHEYKRRAGTENLLGIIGLAKAISLLEKDQDAMILRMRTLRDYFEKELLTHLSDVLINGSGKRVSNTTNLAFLGVDGETLLLNLDQEKIFASHGSACSSGSLEPSRILLEMGIPLSQVRSSIRFSLGRTTTQEEIETAISMVIRIVKRLRSFKSQ